MFDQSQKDEKLSQSWSHPVVLNLGPLGWEPNTLTTRALLNHFLVLGEETTDINGSAGTAEKKQRVLK